MAFIRGHSSLTRPLEFIIKIVEIFKITLRWLNKINDLTQSILLLVWQLFNNHFTHIPIYLKARNRWRLKCLRAKAFLCSQHSTSFNGHKSCEIWNVKFSNCQVIQVRPLIIGNVTIWYEPVNVRLQPGKFGGHRHSGSGDLMVLDCHVIFQKYAAKVSSNFMGESCFG